MSRGIAKQGACGINVFPDGKNPLLDRIRNEILDPRIVITCVSFSVAADVARCYARTHAPHLLPEIDKNFSTFVDATFGGILACLTTSTNTKGIEAP